MKYPTPKYVQPIRMIMRIISQYNVHSIDTIYPFVQDDMTITELGIYLSYATARGVFRIVAHDDYQINCNMRKVNPTNVIYLNLPVCGNAGLLNITTGFTGYNYSVFDKTQNAGNLMAQCGSCGI